MALWSKKEKPSWLTEEQKKNCIATEAGWVLKHANGRKELLVAVRGLKKDSVEEIEEPTVAAEEEPVVEEVVSEDPNSVEEAPADESSNEEPKSKKKGKK